MYRAHRQWCETVLFITKNITQWFNESIRGIVETTSTQFLSNGAFDEIDLRFEQANWSRFAIRRSSNADGGLRIYGSMLTAWLKVRADLCFHCCEISSNVNYTRENRNANDVGTARRQEFFVENTINEIISRHAKGKRNARLSRGTRETFCHALHVIALIVKMPFLNKVKPRVNRLLFVLQRFQTFYRVMLSM